jgi:hypothetical protein
MVEYARTRIKMCRCFFFSLNSMVRQVTAHHVTVYRGQLMLNLLRLSFCKIVLLFTKIERKIQKNVLFFISLMGHASLDNA